MDLNVNNELEKKTYSNYQKNLLMYNNLITHIATDPNIGLARSNTIIKLEILTHQAFLDFARPLSGSDWHERLVKDVII